MLHKILHIQLQLKLQLKKKQNIIRETKDNQITMKKKGCQQKIILNEVQLTKKQKITIILLPSSLK